MQAFDDTVRHWRSDLWRLYAFAGLLGAALMAVSMMPPRNPPEALLLAKVDYLPVWGALLVSVVLAAFLRKASSKWAIATLLLLTVGVWIVAGWSAHNAVRFVTPEAIVAGSPVPWAEDEVIPLGRELTLSLGCSMRSGRAGPVPHLTFDFRTEQKAYSFSDGLGASHRKIDSAWLGGAAAAREAAKSRGVRLETASGGVAPQCLDLMSDLPPDLRRRLEDVVSAEA